MSEENQDKELQKKLEEQNASKQALKAGAKAAANAYAGPIGGKAVDLASKTKLGNAALNVGGQMLNKANPAIGKVANAANKTGALDTAGGKSNNDLAENTPSPETPVETPSESENGKSSGFSLFGGKSSGNGLFSKKDKKKTPSDSSFSTRMFDFFKKNKITLLQILAAVSSFFVVLFLVMVVLLTLAQGVVDFFNGIIDFFTTDMQEAEQEYYETLKEVQDDFHEKYGVCIDVNLITAALTINNYSDDYLEEGQEMVEDAEENPDYNPEDETSEKEKINQYKLMKKQIKLLGKMQIMTRNYELAELKGDVDSYCADPSENILVTEGDKNSSTKELIASHDKDGVLALFTSRSIDEQNNVYYIFRPPFKIEEKENSDGTVTQEKTCSRGYANGMLPEIDYELSIGDLKTMEDSVFYWNLVNSFIPEYYKEYLPSEDPERTERIKKMAEEIYLLYKDIGPSQTCGISYAGPSSLCPNGITVEGVGTIDLEDYVAGVVSNEAYCSEGMEALKAQAVAARTYALHHTNHCENPIANSTNAQTFTRNVNDRAREATKATMGEVLTYNGDIFSSQYDSFCYDDKDCPDSKKTGNVYTVTYTKLPDGKEHTITLSDSAQFGRITHGQGHARGMSQLLSYELAKNGKSYSEILSYFYSDGVSVTYVPPVGGSGKEVADKSVQEKLAYLFPSGLPSSATEARLYMKTVEFSVVDINGVRSTKSATVHKSLAQDFVDIMNKIADSGFPIKDVGCYNWRSAAGSSSRSHHSYGVACDLNVNENYMIKNGKILAGSYWKPGEDPYSFPADGVVVKTFASYGWGWGGSWTSSKDYMHFSFTGR